MNLENENTLNSLLTATPENIHGVNIGLKVKNGQITNDLCVQFVVEKKLPQSQLKKEDLLPKKIKIENIEYETDVLESKKIEALPCVEFDNSPCIPKPQGQGPWGFGCGLLAGSWWPMGEHVSHQRPLRGGIQIAGRPRGQNRGYGTLGGIVLDTTDNTVVGITNAHVAALVLQNYDARPINEKITSFNLYGTLEDTSDFNMYQSDLWGTSTPWLSSPEIKFCLNYPTAPSSITNSISSTQIGYIKRYSTISTIEPNILDVALLTLRNENNTNVEMVSAGYSHTQANFYHKGVCSFATTAEINTLATNRVPLFKSGRTSSATGSPNPLSALNVRFDKSLCQGLTAMESNGLGGLVGPVPYCSSIYQTLCCNNHSYRFSTNCGMTATSVNFSAYVGYNFGSALFEKSIRYTTDSPANPPSLPGDSGSLLYGLFNATNPSTSAWKIVGLVYAGNSFDTGLAVRIDNIASAFNISPYQSTTPTYTNLNNEKKIYIKGVSNTQSLTGNDNRKYWQSGYVYKIGDKILKSPGWIGPNPSNV
jgi:hypothetical protein